MAHPDPSHVPLMARYKQATEMFYVIRGPSLWLVCDITMPSTGFLVRQSVYLWHISHLNHALKVTCARALSASLFCHIQVLENPDRGNTVAPDPYDRVMQSSEEPTHLLHYPFQGLEGGDQNQTLFGWNRTQRALSAPSLCSSCPTHPGRAHYV